MGDYSSSFRFINLTQDEFTFNPTGDAEIESGYLLRSPILIPAGGQVSGIYQVCRLEHYLAIMVAITACPCRSKTKPASKEQRESFGSGLAPPMVKALECLGFTLDVECGQPILQRFVFAQLSFIALGGRVNGSIILPRPCAGSVIR